MTSSTQQGKRVVLYTIPNLLTFFRILAIPGIIISLYTNSFWGNWVAFGFYIIASVTDFFDGYIARVMRQTSMFGKFLDPIADKLLVSAILIAYAGLDRLMNWHLIPVILIVCREIFISGLREFLSDYQIRISVSQLGKWKTTVQMLSLGFLMIYPSVPSCGMIKPIGLGLLWVSTILTIWSGASYLLWALRETRKAH